MDRLVDTSARNTTCQFLKSSLAIAAIAMGFPQTVNAGSLFGNVTADLFAPAVTLTSVIDVESTDPVTAARVAYLELVIQELAEPEVEFDRLLGRLKALEEFIAIYSQATDANAARLWAAETTVDLWSRSPTPQSCRSSRATLRALEEGADPPTIESIRALTAELDCDS